VTKKYIVNDTWQKADTVALQAVAELIISMGWLILLCGQPMVGWWAQSQGAERLHTAVDMR
jgi:hypothetical protein